MEQHIFLLLILLREIYEGLPQNSRTSNTSFCMEVENRGKVFVFK